MLTHEQETSLDDVRYLALAMSHHEVGHETTDECLLPLKEAEPSLRFSWPDAKRITHLAVHLCSNFVIKPQPALHRLLAIDPSLAISARWRTVSPVCERLRAFQGFQGLWAPARTLIPSFPGTLPTCTPSSCAPCNIGASTMCISFPYGTIDQVTSTVFVIPYVTQYKDGRLSTSFSTVTLEEDPHCDFFEADQFTWVTLGRTL
jgi:hypothetical protein